MPTMPPRACRCGRIQPCPTHRRKPWQHAQPSRHARGYGAAWNRLRKEILERDNYTCYRCHGEADGVDHVKPKAQGGTDDPMNLAAICGDCQQKKAGREGAQGRATA